MTPPLQGGGREFESLPAHFFISLEKFYSNYGPVDQLVDRYLGMVEVSGSSPDGSIPIFL